MLTQQSIVHRLLQRHYSIQNALTGHFTAFHCSSLFPLAAWPAAHSVLKHDTFLHEGGKEEGGGHVERGGEEEGGRPVMVGVGIGEA